MKSNLKKSLSKETFQPGDVLEVKILRLSPGGGRGVARHNNLVVFIPFTAPQDIVEVKLTKVKKNYAEAKLLKVITPSPNRIEPQCPHFTKCGGCTLQMLPISEQHNEKQEFLNYAFKEIISKDNTQIEALTPSPKEWRYRNRIQVHYKNSEYGFYAQGSHNLISIKDCIITDKRITQELIKYNNTNSRLEIGIDANTDKIYVSENNRSPMHTQFAQVNTEINQLIQTYIYEKISLIKNITTITDLYAGSGNFSFFLKSKIPDLALTGVELSTHSVKKANNRVKELGLKEINFIQSDVSKYLQKTNLSSDLIVTDPPRMGMGSAVCNSLIKTNAKVIIYVSCDLATMKRDISNLSSSYTLKSLKVFDMFPQTDHMETVAILHNRETI